MDIAVNKSLIALACKDKTVRIYNYLTSKLEVSYSFNEEPLSIAFHPAGYHVIQILKKNFQKLKK
jgi:WD40 repeat protein